MHSGSMNERPTALVTGGAVRIGRATTEALIAAGYRVWVHHCASTQAAQELARAHVSSAPQQPGVLGAVHADLTVAKERERLCKQVTNPKGPAGGRLDLLVNNAASYERGAFAERTSADFERVLALNLVAPVALVRGLLAALQQGPGCVVNILDVAAYHPWPGYLDHCTSKAALAFATRALAVELAPVRVNGVAPGTVAWPADARHAEGSAARDRIEARIPLGKIGSPSDIAQAIVFFAGASHATGQILAIDGGRLAGIAGEHG